MSNTTTIIYSRDNCNYCTKAKKLLNDNNIEYNEINISTLGDDQWTEIKKTLQEKNKIEIKTVPQIILNGNYIGGYNQLQSHLFCMDEEF